MKTLEELFSEYINRCQHVTGLRPETIRSYREVFATFLRIVPEVSTTSMLTEEMVTLFFTRLKTRERIVGRDKKKVGIKDSTVRTYGSKLHSFFDWLVKGEYLEKNPINKLILPKPVFEDHRALKKNEVEKILSAVMAHSLNSLIMRRDVLIIYTLVFCGLRRNELLSLQIRDIDRQKRLITVRAETSKSKRTRLIPIHPTLMMHIDEYLKERSSARVTSEYLFVGNGGNSRFTSHGLKHWVKRIEVLSGVKFHVHRFRHTFATNLAHQNTGAVKIQKLMGHSSLNMTSKYLRSMNAEDLSDDVGRLSIEGLA